MPLENFAIDDSLLEVAPAHVSDAQAGEVLHRHFGLSGTLEKLSGARDLHLRVPPPDGAYRLLKLWHPLEHSAVVDFHTY